MANLVLYITFLGNDLKLMLGIAVTTVEINTVKSYAEMILEHIKESRTKYKKISCEALKFWSSAIYNFAEQSRRFDKHLPIGREGIEFISEH